MNEQVIRSERTHLMCPNMHFGIRFSLCGEFAPEKIRETLSFLAAAHPFLRALICRYSETGELFYHVTDHSRICCRSFATEDELLKAWSDIAHTEWNVFEMGLLKVFSCPHGSDTMVLFAAHHLLTDGRGLLDLACEFADCIADGKMPKLTEERLIASMDDLPKGSDLAPISRLLVDRAGKQWRKENHTVSYDEYLQFAAAYGKAHPIQYRRDEMDAVALADLRKACREAGISVNDWLMAQTYLKTGANKIIVAVDLRQELPCYRPGALGNYASAMGIVCRTKTTNLMEKGKEVHALMQKALSNPRAKMLVLACYLRMNAELLDAAAISALGGFCSKAASFVGGGMFGFSKPKAYSITNLGKFENPHMTFAEFIPPASPASLATVGILTTNGIMRTVTSSYEHTSTDKHMPSR